MLSRFQVSSGFLVYLAHECSFFVYPLKRTSALLFYILETPTQNGLCRYLHFLSLLSMHYLLILVSFLLAGACLLCLPLSLLLGSVSSFVIYIPLSRYTFFLGSTFDVHTPCTLSIIPPVHFQIRRLSLIQCFFIAHPRPSTIVLITVSFRLHT